MTAELAFNYFSSIWGCTVIKVAEDCGPLLVAISDHGHWAHFCCFQPSNGSGVHDPPTPFFLLGR